MTGGHNDTYPGALADHVVLTGADGILRGMTSDGVQRIADAAADSERVVFHFHGGLVSEGRGWEIAAGLLPVYRGAGAYPVFFVWRSGLLEILRGNISEIADESAFKALTKLAVKFAVGKVLGAGVARGGLQAPPEVEVLTELARRAGHEEPYSDLAAPDDVSDLTAAEEALIEQQMAADPQLRAAARAIADSALSPEERAGARSATGLERASSNTLMSPEIVDELQVGAAQPGERSVLTGAVLAKHGVIVVRNTVRRFRAGREHGVYCTVVEEILREFYAANAGARVWSAMKQETAQTFIDGAPARGGATFMRALAGSLRAGAAPRITLVGHSTGAVFINNLLGHVEQMRADPHEPLPGDFRFEGVAFLAPACTFKQFAPVMAHRDHLWRHFRLFTMTDAAERCDHLVPLVYPRSLLYFVSGVLETGASGKSEAGMPVLGLARCFDHERDDDPVEIREIRDWIRSDRALAVWSPSDSGPGLASGALTHGDFDDDAKVRESLQVLIRGAA